MSREVFEELKQDEAFVEKVANRIYIDSDDFEDSMSEPEWICEMTDIADKYIQRFKLAFKLANKMSNQPTLNDNQQVVLEWLKKEYAERNLFPTEVAWLLLESFDNGYFEPEEERAFENLNKLQEAQVLQAFSAWSLEQEEE